MKLEIKEAIDKGDKIVLKMEYDWDFALAVSKVLGIRKPDDEDIEAFVTMVLENMDIEDLGELGDQIDE
jgi:hypothetical protein